jgi:hypothetical protein
MRHANGGREMFTGLIILVCGPLLAGMVSYALFEAVFGEADEVDLE